MLPAFKVGDEVEYRHPHMEVKDLDGSFGYIVAVFPRRFQDPPEEVHHYHVNWESGPAVFQKIYTSNTRWGEPVLHLSSNTYDPTQMGDTDEDI